MTDCLANPVVAIPLLVSVGTGANTGYLDFNIDPEDLMPPDEKFWSMYSGHDIRPLYISPKGKFWVVAEYLSTEIPVPPTKAHAKMLIHLLTGRTDLWKTNQESPTSKLREMAGGE